MSPLPRPGPEYLNQLESEAAPGNGAPETDVAELAARFREKSAGNVSPEMAAELALEVVLNKIVEQACRATNATGAAIALARAGEMVCRASSGSTAPDLGAQLDTNSGLTGECCMTRETQRCADALADARVDIEASARLGVRSVIVMPLVRHGELAGVFELLSCLPSVFSEREERILEGLAKSALRSLDQAEQSARPQVNTQPEIKAASKPEVAAGNPAPNVGSNERPPQKSDPKPHQTSEPKTDRRLESRFVPQPSQGLVLSGARLEELEVTGSEVGSGGRSGFDLLSFALGAAVLACTALLGVGIGRRFEARRVAAKTVAPQTQSASPTQAQAAQSSSLADAKNSDPGASSAAGNVRSSGAAVPPGGLVVYQGSKEVFRLQPDGTPATSIASQPKSTEKILQVSPIDAQALLVHRVEPDYPADARLKKIQGIVVLAIKVSADGSVEDIQYEYGPKPLATAAVDAVKQWRFKPQTVNGSPAEMQTRVALQFRLHE